MNVRVSYDISSPYYCPYQHQHMFWSTCSHPSKQIKGYIALCDEGAAGAFPADCPLLKGDSEVQCISQLSAYKLKN